jgi:hypothetical protein
MTQLRILYEPPALRHNAEKHLWQDERAITVPNTENDLLTGWPKVSADPKPVGMHERGNGHVHRVF